MKKRLFIIILTLSLATSMAACGSSSKQDQLAETTEDTASESKTEETETEVVDIETKETDEQEETEEQETQAAFPVDIHVEESYKNDVTGNWRLATTADSFEIQDLAVDYYNTYFKSDEEIHVIVNFTLGTTTKISKLANFLDVTIHEYVDGEEHDAKSALEGMVLGQYYVYLDSGEIQKIQ